jgi:hypothetical protein
MLIHAELPGIDLKRIINPKIKQNHNQFSHNLHERVKV